jgi:TetR/AcrR family transcriptional regulator
MAVGYPRIVSLPDYLMPAPVGRERLSRDVLEEHHRKRVLDAAVEVFAKRGYTGTTVDHIVGAAQIGVGSFYKLFDGKEECFLQAYDHIVEEARERIAAAIPEEAPYAERVCAALRSLLELIGEEPLRARVVLVEAQTAGPKALARYEQTMDGAVPYLRRLRDVSEVADELPPTLEEATVGGIAWLLHQRLVMGEVDGIESLFPELVDVAIAQYLGEEQAERLVAAVQAPPKTAG